MTSSSSTLRNRDAIRFYILKDENGAPDREVLAMLKEIAIGTEVLVVAEGETFVQIEARQLRSGFP